MSHDKGYGYLAFCFKKIRNNLSFRSFSTHTIFFPAITLIWNQRVLHVNFAHAFCFLCFGHTVVMSTSADGGCHCFSLLKTGRWLFSLSAVIHKSKVIKRQQECVCSRSLSSASTTRMCFISSKYFHADHHSNLGQRYRYFMPHILDITMGVPLSLLLSKLTGLKCLKMCQTDTVRVFL